jgi:hypothetical protein
MAWTGNKKAFCVLEFAKTEPIVTSAASPRMDISSTCKVGQKHGVSLPLFICFPSAWPPRLLYRRGRKSRRDLWITLYNSWSLPSQSSPSSLRHRALSPSHTYYWPPLGVFVLHSMFLYWDTPTLLSTPPSDWFRQLWAKSLPVSTCDQSRPNYSENRAERFDPNFVDVGNPLVTQLGRYLRWPSVDQGPLKQADRDRQHVLATSKKRPCWHTESWPPGTFRLPWLRFFPCLFLQL